MNSTAIIFEKPGSLVVRSLELVDPDEGDIVVDSLWSGISTGTEKMLYQGSMPAFPGMGYPLVPGYETVGRVVDTGSLPSSGKLAPGMLVFVPGARCYKDAAGLFGASASRLVVSGERVVAVDEALGRDATLLSIAATAFHAVSLAATPPELIIGHGLVGRLAARICVALGFAA
ncbi:MAG: chlorophyll synthesis pathway protein BchC, partial [Nitratireductor sp.]